MTHTDLRTSALDRLLRGASAASLGLALLASPAFAQINPDEQEPSGINTDTGFESDEIVVTGIRRSLENAQTIKRDSDAFVDAITATDIGALPDRSVSEALQRVPGVNVLRFAGPDDPDHFSVEGSGVIVRGLPFVRSELNGRDVFSANQGGGLGFEDVSPELLGSVQVFKNQTADMIEGGIAGTVDLRTRLPFDSAERVAAFSIEGTYSDLVDEITPSVSGLFADRIETSKGEFGFLINGSWNNLESQAEQQAISFYFPNIDNGDGTFTRFPNNGGSGFVNNGNGPEFPEGFDPASTVYVPGGASIRRQVFDRERQGFALAGQYENLDRTLLATAQFFRSESELAWNERVIETTIDDAAYSPRPEGDLLFDGDGVLQRGTITTDVGWRGDFGGGTQLPLDGPQQSINTRERLENETITDYAFNLKYTPTDNLRLNGDIQYVKATNETFDVSVFFGSVFDVAFDNTVGGVPDISFTAPDGFDQQGYFNNPDNFFFRAKMDHAQDNEAEEVAFRGDAEYDFSGDGFLKGVRFGGRYAEQEADVRYSTFNWGNVSEIWTFLQRPDGSPIGTRPGDNIIRLSDPRVAGLIGFETFDDYQRGNRDPGIPGVPIYAGALTNYGGFEGTINLILESAGRGGPNNFPTLRNRAGAFGQGTVDGGLFLPSEITNTQIDTTAFYGRLDFGNEFGNGMSIDGNVGLRWVETDITATGSFESASLNQFFNGDPDTVCTPPTDLPPGAPVDLPTVCQADSAQLRTFLGDGTEEFREAENTFDNFLPSLNMKLNLNEDMLIRFGASRSISRPNDQQLRNDRSFGFSEAAGQFQNFTLGSQTGGNPFLEPVKTDQFDLSFEWYFGDADSFTVSGFTKSLDGIFVSELFQTEITNNGVTLPIVRERLINSEEEATLRGVEVAYQQFYDFLPGVLSGLGAQFNYTYIDDDGVGVVDQSVTANFPVNSDRLERVSKHQFNLVGLYEKGPIQARLAYNWRDDFLLTRRDVIFPFNSIFQEATGQLDGSIFYDVNENIKVGVQGVNLLDDITETTQTIDPFGLRAPRAFNRNDRRISFILRGNF